MLRAKKLKPLGLFCPPLSLSLHRFLVNGGSGVNHGSNLQDSKEKEAAKAVKYYKMTDYQETIDYLFRSVPMFQQVGGTAYKEGLGNTLALDRHLGHPHRAFRSIHVGGTNGKGSCSHTLAAILQCAGYKTGLYTSPHLADFRERIRVDGVKVPEQFVVDFVRRHKAFFEPLHPSFFELATAMAFQYFAAEKVDVAIVEVGLGGRLDCTNIIRPALSIITNISFDHVQYLGNTLAEIAGEKAGIIKSCTPVVIGEANEETRPVFIRKAQAVGAPIVFAEDEHLLRSWRRMPDGKWLYQTEEYADLRGELGGLCQLKNTATLLSDLRRLQECGFHIHEQDIRDGFGKVTSLTGLMGRWQQLEQHPDVVCDTGHNTGGMSYIAEQLARYPCRHLHIIIGMVSDKDVDGVLALLPKDAEYYFTKAQIQRAMPEETLQALAMRHHLQGGCFPSVKDALAAAKGRAGADDLIFVGGSTFVVADLLAGCGYALP